MARPGDIRVNSTDYDGDVVIEQYAHWNCGLTWAVPAWEERGDGDLAGPFVNRAEAEDALIRYEAIWA